MHSWAMIDVANKNQVFIWTKNFEGEQEKELD